MIHTVLDGGMAGYYSKRLVIIDHINRTAGVFVAKQLDDERGKTRREIERGARGRFWGGGRWGCGENASTAPYTSTRIFTA